MIFPIGTRAALSVPGPIDIQGWTSINHSRQSMEGFLMNRQQLTYCFLLALVLIVANNQTLFGQGKIARVRDAVRHSKSSPLLKKEQPQNEQKVERIHQQRSSRSNDSRRNRPARPAKRRRQPRRNCAPRIPIGLHHHNLWQPQQAVHVVHHASAPIVAQSVIVEPIYQSVVGPVASPVAETSRATADYFLAGASGFDWGIRLSAIGGTDFDDIAFGRFDLLLQSPNGIGVDTSVTMLRESGMSFRDHLFLGDVNFVFEPIASNNFRFRIGVGVNWLGDSYGGDAGFNMTTGFDLRLTERLIATGEVDFGSIGETDITHAQISLGRIISPSTEWTVGYDNLDIGGVTIGSAFTGLRFRF